MREREQSSLPGETEVSLRMAILDAQVVDTDELPVGRVDDVELDVDRQGLHVVALLTGQRHLGARLGGVMGAFLARSAVRLADAEESARLDPGEISDWDRSDGLLTLRSPMATLRVAGLERWLSTHVVRHLPGADREGI